jgi:hypothetical protein
MADEAAHLKDDWWPGSGTINIRLGTYRNGRTRRFASSQLHDSSRAADFLSRGPELAPGE